MEDVPGKTDKLTWFGKLVQARNEGGIQFNGVDRNTAASEMLGHFTMARTDFDPAEIVASRIGLWPHFRGMSGNMDGPGDLFSPPGITQEMLSKLLPCHR